MDPIQSVQDLVVAKYEMEFFNQVAEIWNRKRRAWTIFPEFLRMVYSGRVLRESSLEREESEPVTIPMPLVQPRRAARRAA